MKVSVVGAGSWGSAVAWLLGTKGETVSLWARDESVVTGINTAHHSPRYLEDTVFPATVTASTDLGAVLAKTEAIVLVTPSAVVGEMAERIAAHLGTGCDENVPLVLLSKGIEGSTGTLLLDVLAKHFDPRNRQGADEPPASAERFGAAGHCGWPEQVNPHEHLAVLSGPNHAEEVVRGIPSATVVASLSQTTAQLFQELFATPTFRVYTSHDVVGVQLCGAAKNIIAIACGLAAGLGLGDNTTALLMTRGLAEIGRLVEQLGGDARTCMGLAGMGDLIATCTSEHSRNRAFGLELARGGTLEAYQTRTHMVVEGAVASRSVAALAQKHTVDMPISKVVHDIIWEQQPIEEAVASLIERSLKPEFY
ncbi:MAG: NAD(P)-dependent glycerol-3-phosphate dehydrogenase [Coriobacteriales bacterium]|jgi:glycerol-3-phosphate dehydrogenase (NAD(P)+)|nr:NAD(P)-dependent glycerol-3-phosphate dehydrogenase [Coriobacteriales bacterium]